MKYYQELMTSKGRKEHGAFIVEGIRQISQIVQSKDIKIFEILTVEPLDFATNVTVKYINRSQLNKITETKTPNGSIAIVQIPRVKEIDAKTTKGNILLLEDIQDPGNVGNLVRTAAAFGFSAVILSRGCADIYSPKVVRSTGGAICNLDIISRKDIFDCVATLKKQGYQLAVADLDGKKELSIGKNEKVLLALGNEGNGVSGKLKSIADFVFTIPFNSNKIESLNVSSAGAIAMYLLRN